MTNSIDAQSRILLAALDVNVDEDTQLSGDIQRAREVVECLLSD